MENRNPLQGTAEFDKKGNLWIKKGIKFGGQLSPKVKPREWFYLLWEATKESRNKYNLENLGIKKIKRSFVGSNTTQWRTKKKLIEKGYL